ncbi:IS110 family RNA-guided transposase [Rhodobacter maris]|uniref:Transposase n=1 Tax=Rhodobacter maris TaxID=446682 RepID=A0A285TI59_9RHOB|nr:IS110 family transposase [Rhodobacter maris]SOC21761.1 transposase [Rhodobacter maris]
MDEVTTIGLDLAKTYFQVHGVDERGRTVVQRRLRRSEVLVFFRKLSPCLVGMEACATAHHWARELLELGHDVRLMPPAYVKAYVKRGKTDAADAEAICEAVTRPSMRFVAVKTVDQQGVLMLHKTRDLLVRQRTMPVNALRGHLAEFGLVTAKGAAGVKAAIAAFVTARDMLPAEARATLGVIAAQLRGLEGEIEQLEGKIVAWHRANETSRRLATIPGIGPITASAIAAAVPDGSMFRSGRQFAARLGLTPRAHSSGGRVRKLGISKQGDGYLRRLLVVGATAVMRMARQPTKAESWAGRLLERKPAKLAAVAQANKTARIAWAVMTRGTVYAATAA